MMETLTIELSTGGYLGIVAAFVSDPSLIGSKHRSRYMAYTISGSTGVPA